MLKIISNCGPCEPFIGKCIDSLRAQTFRGWEAYVTIDPCGDRTYEAAIEAAGGDGRIHVHRNPERLYAMVNLIDGIGRSNAAPEDVIVVVDGDDWLHTERALEIVAGTYTRHDCWLTYGSWISNHPNDPGRWPPYDDGETHFRQTYWRATAIRTFKKWLWDLVDERDFRDPLGNYFRVVEDLAVMFPMLEMSTTEKARHVAEVLLMYNRANPYCAADMMRDETCANTATIRARQPYAPLYRTERAVPAEAVAIG
jgi:glycosyltransferase involved in cell wall biosynthesis